VIGADPGSVGITFINPRDALAAQDEPSVEVHSWRLIKAPSGELHLGTLRDRQADRAVVRLTSALAAFDMAASAVTTASGRRYLLMGPPESRSMELIAIRNGAAQLGLAAGIDISAQFWAQICQASGGGDGNSPG
jgi:hypothetical protein